MAGALFIWMTDWYGRTWHIFFGCLGVCVGTIITALSTSLPMLIAGLSAFISEDPSSLPVVQGGNIYHGNKSLCDEVMTSLLPLRVLW